MKDLLLFSYFWWKRSGFVFYLKVRGMEGVVDFEGWSRMYHHYHGILYQGVLS